jgi:hypothetical protein
MGLRPLMAYVPGFEHDVFISYPRESDRADPQGVQWVREFHRYLETALNQRIPSRDKPDIFIDNRDFEAGNHSTMLIEAARKSALFIAVVSPSYVAPGKFTLDELEAFCAGGDARNRIVAVYVLPVDEDLQPQHLYGPCREDFHWFNERHVAIPLTSQFRAGDYNSKVQTIAQHIKNRLDDLRRRAGVAPDERRRNPVFAGKTVLLAPGEKLVRDEWQTVRNYLNEFGVGLLPERDYPEDEAQFAQALAADVAKADLFVQLLSPRDDLIAWTEGRAGRARLEAAAAKRAARPLPILQWLDPAIDAEKLKKIHWDAELLEGPDVLRVGLQEFQREIKRRLDSLSRPPEPKPEKSANPFVYIAADEHDLDHALQLQGIASKHGAVSRIMEDENKLRDFRKQIKLADVVVFLYGAAPRRFVDDWLATYVKIKMGEGRKNARVEAVYYTPPPKSGVKDKLRTSWDGLCELGSHDTFLPEDIEKVFSELRRGADR